MFFVVFDVLGPFLTSGGPGTLPKASWRWQNEFPSNMSPWRATRLQNLRILMFFDPTFFRPANIFRRNRSFIRPPSLEPRRKMTANGLSSYQLFVKNLTFPRQKLKFPELFLLFNHLLERNCHLFEHFLILCTLGPLLKGLCFLVMLLFFGHTLLCLE